MRRTLFLLAILVPATALVGLLWESRWRLFGSAPSLARKSGPEPLTTGAASRPHAVVLAEGSGSDLFVQRDADAIIGGKQVRYPRSFASAKSYASAGAGLVLASEPIMVFNAPPKSDHDVARLLTIVTAAGSTQSGRSLAAAFGTHTGIRGKHARIEGDLDLTRVSRIEFLGEVEAVLIDPEVPDDQTHLATERLVLDFDGKDLVGIRTEAPFTITRPVTRDLTLSARGLEFKLREHSARLLHDIRIEAVLPGHLDASRTPFTLSTPGPIDVEIGKRPGKPGSFAIAGSRAVATGGVAFAQGDLHGTAERATVVCTAASKIGSIDLVGDVRIVSPDGEAQGSRLLATPEDDRRFLKMEGHPITARLDRRSSTLPLPIGTNATLTTNGVVLVSPMREGPDQRRGRTIEVGPVVSITSDTGRLDARRVLAWTASDRNADVPFRVTFEEVEAHDAETTIHADRLAIVRQGIGAAVDDHIALTGAYDVLYRPKPAGANRATLPDPDRPVPQRDVPDFQGGPVRVKGGGALEITRPLLDNRAMVVVVRDDFHMESLGPDEAKPRGTLDAESARMVLEPTGPSITPAAAPARTLTSFTAERRVRVELTDRARARGEKLTYDARQRQIALVGSGTDEPAHVRRTNPDSKDWLEAGRIVFHQDLLLVVATQSVNSEIALAPLPWIGDAKRPRGETIMSKVHAQRLAASLDAERYTHGEVVPTEIIAEVAVRLEQTDRVLTCDSARLDAAIRAGTVRGAPLRYAVVRTVDGTAMAEGLVCPSITLDDRRVLVEGPAEVLFHAHPVFPAQRRRSGHEATRPASRPARPPLQTLTLRCSRRAVLTDDAILAEGRVQVEQGDARVDGMTAAADSAIAFIDKSTSATSRSAPEDAGLIVLEGNAKYASPDIDAASDVMKLNRVTNQMALFNERPEKITVIIHRKVHESDVVDRAASLEVDFTNSKLPRIVERESEATLAPDTRSSSR